MLSPFATTQFSFPSSASALDLDAVNPRPSPPSVWRTDAPGRDHRLGDRQVELFGTVVSGVQRV